MRFSELKMGVGNEVFMGCSWFINVQEQTTTTG